MNKIKRFRTELKLSQKELAEKAGLSVNTIYAIEQGHRNPLLTTIRKLARSLGKSIDDLFGIH